MIAKTEASGGSGLLSEVLAFSSSLALDKQLLREDLVGSLAHLAMLSRQGIIPKNAARSIQGALADIWTEMVAGGSALLPDEEDVHMAVEAVLAERLGEIAGLLHSARSRNDQVALDLHLHVRERSVGILTTLADWLELLCDRAEAEQDTLLPSYTHRQRAQPISLAYLLCAYGAMFARDAAAFSAVLDQVDRCPLGVGAIAGTTLPTDRDIPRALLGFSSLTLNGLDTVGDRDFALDYTFAATKLMLHASRVSTDLVDFTSAEFGYARLDGEIACGSSMMPQKRNPDVFELIRGKSGRAVGNLVSLLVAVKGLPAGYNRDLQEDRGPLLETGALVESVLSILKLSLPRVRFNVERCRQAVANDAMQATDLAEALVKKGLPFRTAYQLVGALVRKCQEASLTLGQVTADFAATVDPRLTPDVLETLDALGSVQRKRSPGSPGPESVKAQLAQLRQDAKKARERAQSVPRLSQLFDALKEASL